MDPSTYLEFFFRRGRRLFKKTIWTSCKVGNFLISSIQKKMLCTLQLPVPNFNEINTLGNGSL